MLKEHVAKVATKSETAVASKNMRELSLTMGGGLTPKEARWTGAAGPSGWGMSLFSSVSLSFQPST